MTIKHLVLSGGGPIMIQLLGAIQHLETNNFIDLKNIESIYGTSAGAIVGILICLKHEYDWETINDYIIKRPWKDVFKIKVEKILESYSKKGIFDIKTIEKCFKPLFAAKDIARRTAGCQESVKSESRASKRSAAMTYWVRSLVPRLPKSTSAKTLSAKIAAAGVSIITPT